MGEPVTEAGRRLLKLGQQNAWPYDYPETILAIEREAADAARKEVVDALRAELLTMKMVGNPATTYEYREGVRYAIDRFDSLARPVEEEK